MRSRSTGMQAIVIVAAIAALMVPGIYLRADDTKVEGDLKKLQGTWLGKAGNGDKVTYVFKGNTLKVTAPKRSYEMTVTLNDAAKPEKTIDFKIVEAPEDAKGKTCLGIYRLDGDDKLTFCYTPEGSRPTAYEMVGYEQILAEVIRDKN